MSAPSTPPRVPCSGQRADAAVGPGSPATQAAALRLGASRLRLALALATLRVEAGPPPDEGGWFGDPTGGPTGGPADAWAACGPFDRADAGRSVGAGLFNDLLDAVGLRGHAPLAWLAWRVGRSLGRDRLAIWSTRHPWRLVGAAALGGALLVGARPWRWLMRPAVVVGLLMQLAAAGRGPRPASPAPAEPPRSGRWRRTTGQQPGVFR